MSEAIYIEEALIEMADERQAQQLLRFFKTLPVNMVRATSLLD